MLTLNNHPSHPFSTDASSGSDGFNEEDELSMEALLRNQDDATADATNVLDAEWTQQAIEREKQRRKNLAKRMKEA